MALHGRARPKTSPSRELIFPDDFVARLPDDELTALSIVVQHFLLRTATIGEVALTAFTIDDAVIGHLLLVELTTSLGLQLNLVDLTPELVTSNSEAAKARIALEFKEVDQVLRTKRVALLLAESRSRIQAVRGKLKLFEFSDPDFRRIQQLLNELRDLVTHCSELSNPHRQRVLSRLEQLQADLHKRTSNIDRLFGVCIEAASVIGQIGKNAKPMVDRLRELSQLAWGAHNRGLDLPTSSNPPSLPDGGHHG